jgi:hypothetical protein
MSELELGPLLDQVREVSKRLSTNEGRLERICERRNKFMERHPQDFYIGENWAGLIRGNRSLCYFLLKDLDLRGLMARTLSMQGAAYATSSVYAASCTSNLDRFAEYVSLVHQQRIEAMKSNIATMAEMEQDAVLRLRHLDEGEGSEEAALFLQDCSKRVSEMKNFLCILERADHVPSDEADCIHCDFKKES